MTEHRAKPEAAAESAAPQTLEGWFVLHDVYALDWPAWRALDAAQRAMLADEARSYLANQPADQRGRTAAFAVLSQKGDLMLMHFRTTPEAISQAELDLRQTRWYRYLQPRYSFFSVVELSLYELTAIARGKLAGQGIMPGSEQYEEMLAMEMDKQHRRVKPRLFPVVPPRRYICFYPMSKRRGEQVNWYTLSIEERRSLMRGHGTIGHKYHERVTQIISGAVGLDDWEWGVSLFADDMVDFKKLIYEMRFDAASAPYAEFGPFYTGIHLDAEGLHAFLEGSAPASVDRPSLPPDFDAVAE